MFGLSFPDDIAHVGQFLLYQGGKVVRVSQELRLERVERIARFW